MANSLVDILKSGDKDALNAYLSTQIIGGDAGGISVGGQPNNVLSSLVRPQIQNPQISSQNPQIPQGSNVITNASLGYGPQGMQQVSIGGNTGYRNQQGDIISYTPSGEAVKIGAGELAGWQQEGQKARQQQELIDTFQRAKVMEQVGKAQEALGGGGAKPTFNADAGGYIYPPSPQNPQGRFVPVAGFQKPEKPLTEYQGQSVMYGTRAADSHNLLNSLEDKVNTSGLRAAQYTENIPLIGSAAHAMLTPEQQQVDQAQRNFVNAVMRRESGATISPMEFENAKKQYFPMPGDSEAVIEQKRRNREMVVTGFARGAGPGAKDINEVLQSNPYAQLGKSSSKGNTVTAPDGTVHSFPNAAAADAFRKAIGA